MRLRQHLSYQYFPNLSDCSETCKVSIASGVKVHTIHFFWVKASYRSRKKNMPQSVEASTQPCFTQLLIGKGSEVERTKDVIILRSLGGHPIVCRRVNRPFLMTRLKALVKSIKAIYPYAITCRKRPPIQSRVNAFQFEPLINEHFL